MPLNTNDVEYVLNDCRIKLPGASDSGIKQELWGVIKTFLQDTNLWVEYQKLLVTAGVNQYVIAPRDGGQIIRLVGVIDGNRTPVRASMADLGLLDIQQTIQVSSVDVPPTDTSTAPNHPWCVGLMKNIVLPGTKDNMPIAPEVVLKVYSDCIISGVLGNMMLQQAKSYTNVQLGNFHLKKFNDQKASARSDATNANIFGGQRWAFPQQFATHTQRGSYGAWPFMRGV